MVKQQKICKTLIIKTRLIKKIKNRKLMNCLNNIIPVEKNTLRQTSKIKTQRTKEKLRDKQNLR
jgi:hypothetical protein